MRGLSLIRNIGSAGFLPALAATALVMLIAALAAGPAAAESDRKLAQFASGNWSGGAWAFDDGTFSHCEAGVVYGNDIELVVSIDGDSRWYVGFDNADWNFKTGALVTVNISIDGRQVYNGRAEALYDTYVDLKMPDDRASVDAFRLGGSLTATIQGRSYTFRLTGTNTLIPALADCVKRYLNVKIAAVPPPSTVKPATPAAPATSTTPAGSTTPAARPPSSSTGTGFVITVAGHVVTNDHVVDVCKTISVSQPGEPPVAAAVVARDTSNDLALLKTEMKVASVDLARLRLGRPVPAGEKVAVYGFPLQGALATSGNVVEGNISAVAGLGNDTSHFQITAPIQPGNSGGPLLDFSATVVGVTDSTIDQLKVADAIGAIPQNVNFAIKATVLANFLEAQGVAYQIADTQPSPMDLVGVAAQARKFTVLVSCRN